jgi:hypothetical protein
MKIIIISPSLDINVNVSGISSVTKFIIDNNPRHDYYHFELGKKDNEKRSILRFLRILKTYLNWIWLLIFLKNAFIHFNMPLT